MTDITSILWDMDGVLVETSEAHYRSWMAAADHFGFSFNRKLFLRYYGMNNISTLRGALGAAPSEERINQISNYKETSFRDAVKDSIELLPGVAEWLERFKKRNYRQAVASSGPAENIDLAVKVTGIRKYFSALVSCAENPTKPDPWVFLEAARQLDSQPVSCLVIEDTPNGIRAARNAGMQVLAVTTSNPASVLQEADLVIENLACLDWDLFTKTFLQEHDHE